MALQKLVFKPGINRETTNYANEGGWWDGDKIRFRGGVPEKIGGWLKVVREQFQGSCRALHEWMSLDKNRYLAVGTHLKYYIYWGGTYFDITPWRTDDPVAIPVTAPDLGPFKTEAGATTLIVTHVGHGATYNDFVFFAGATAFDAYAAADLNKEFKIVEVIDGDHYRIDTGIRATTSGITGGGTAVTGHYQIATGLDIAVPGTGWGTGVWGGTPDTHTPPPPIDPMKGGWGMEYSYIDELNIPYTQIRLWSQDNFGEDLIFCIRGGAIYYWDRTRGTQERAVELQRMPTAKEAPTYAFHILLSEGDRHVVAIGTNDLGATFLDPLLVRWSSQEDPFDWEPRRDNTAGTYRLSSGSNITGALRTRQETLIWTEKNMHSMRFTGSPYVFGFNLIAENVSIASPTAAVNANGTVYWMDRSSFWTYVGQVAALPCTVLDYVFSDMNQNQRMKIHAGHNHNYQEVIWFYPSKASDEIDRYVTYNYLEQVWYYGTLERTAWLDLVFGETYPLGAANGYLYHHEYGNDADGEALPAWIESSDTDLADGNQFVFIRRVLPDIFFRGASQSMSVGFTLKSRRAPGDFYITKAKGQITPATRDCWIRTRGRQFSIRIESDAPDTGWRAGAFRFDMQPDGRR